MHFVSFIVSGCFSASSCACSWSTSISLPSRELISRLSARDAASAASAASSSSNSAFNSLVSFWIELVFWPVLWLLLLRSSPPQQQFAWVCDIDGAAPESLFRLCFIKPSSRSFKSRSIDGLSQSTRFSTELIGHEGEFVQ